MKLFLRTAAAVAIGATVGVLSLGAPASAEAGSLTAAESCAGYDWKIRWKLVAKDADGADGVLSDVVAAITLQDIKGQPPNADGTTPPPPPPLTLPELTTLVDGAEVSDGTVILDEQIIAPGLIREVELTLTITWTKGGKTRTENLKATGSRLACSPPGDAGATPPPPPGGPDPEDAADPDVAPPVGNGGGAGPGDGGGLPVTGAAAGTVVAAAAVLLAAGSALFLAARRRRIKFAS